MLKAAATLRRLMVRPDVVAIVGALLTLAIAGWFQHLVELRTRERFARLADQAVLYTENRLETYVALLSGAAGLFAASETVTREEFERYAGQIDLPRRYPGAQGLGYAARLNSGAPGARAAALPPGVRPWPGPAPRSAVVHLQPLDRRNRAALGFDMMSEPVRREAMARARDQGVPAASGPVVLVQEIDEAKQPGFLVYMPLYDQGAAPETVAERRARHVGWVYAPFRTHDLFRQTFAGTGLLDQVDVEVFELQSGEQGLLFASTGGDRRPSRFRAERALNVAGREWVIRLRASDGFPAPPWWRTTLPLLLAGFALTAASATAARAQADGLSRAQAAEAEALRAKVKAEFLLREVNHRVANSLQLVSSLVALQADVVKDPAARAALQDTRARILAVGRVHQRLYGDDGAGHVDLKAYLQHLVAELAESLEGAGPRLQFRGEEAAAHVDADLAVGVGVAVAELVTNAAKYAYPDGRPGEIRVRLTPRDSRLQVCVEDDGVGMAADKKPTGSGLGMKVVKAMAADLAAELEVGPGDHGGLRVALLFAPRRQA